MRGCVWLDPGEIHHQNPERRRLDLQLRSCTTRIEMVASSILLSNLCSSQSHLCVCVWVCVSIPVWCKPITSNYIYNGLFLTFAAWFGFQTSFLFPSVKGIALSVQVDENPKNRIEVYLFYNFVHCVVVFFRETPSWETGGPWVSCAAQNVT